MDKASAGSLCRNLRPGEKPSTPLADLVTLRGALTDELIAAVGIDGARALGNGGQGLLVRVEAFASALVESDGKDRRWRGPTAQK